MIRYRNKKIIKSVIEDFDLFVVEDGVFYSPSLSRRMQKAEEKSKVKSDAGGAGAEKRWKNDRQSDSRSDGKTDSKNMAINE